MPEIDRIAHLLADPSVTDVLIGRECSSLIEVNSVLVKVENVFQDEAEISTWIRKFFNEIGGRLDISHPISEASIETSFGLLRVHALLAGECSESTQVSIRRHGVSALSLNDLLTRQTITNEQLEKLKQIIKEKENFVIVGGTGTGKTTLLRAMLNEVAYERVITIEENFELRLSGNSIALKTRMNNHEGVGEISLTQLLREALRMRPDRLVIGEARGEELKLLLQSLNTGHSGAGFSLHANSHREALPRMLSMLNLSGLPSKLAKEMIASSIQWVIEINRTSIGRKVSAIERLS